MFRRRLALTLLALGLAAPALAAAPPAPCPSACLLDLVNRYLDGMVAHDVSSLPFAPGLKATENGRAFKPGEGVWKTARAIVYRQTVVDASVGQAVFYGVLLEAEGQAVFVVRLAVTDRTITEVETLVARKGAHPIFSPESLRTVKPVWNQVVPESERATRAALSAVANGYFEAIEKHSPGLAAFHPDCNRTENGVQTTNNDGSEFMRSSCSSGLAQFTYIERVRSRRYPIVDVERGVVLAIVHFDVPGRPAAPASGGDVGTVLATTPRTLLLYELFKVEQGRIREVQAFMANAPLGASNGWER